MTGPRLCLGSPSPDVQSLAKRRAADTDAPGHLSRARILVVEDREDLRELLVTALETEGHDVAVCDLARDPMAGETDRVAFTPTLVKRYPAPRMWVLGNLREPEIVGDLLRACGLDAKI